MRLGLAAGMLHGGIAGSANAPVCSAAVLVLVAAIGLAWARVSAARSGGGGPSTSLGRLRSPYSRTCAGMSASSFSCVPAHPLRHENDAAKVRANVNGLMRGALSVRLGPLSAGFGPWGTAEGTCLWKSMRARPARAAGLLCGLERGRLAPALGLARQLVEAGLGLGVHHAGRDDDLGRVLHAHAHGVDAGARHEAYEARGRQHAGRHEYADELLAGHLGRDLLRRLARHEH